MRWGMCWAAAGVVMAGALPAWGQYACVEGVGVRDGRIDEVAVAMLLQMHPRCVHLDLRRDLWAGVDDPASRGPGQESFWGIYTRLVELYRANGAEVVLSVGADVVESSTGGLGDTAVRQRYITAVRRVVTALPGRLLAVELAGEPNGFDASGHEALGAEGYARVVTDAQEVWLGLLPTLRCRLPKLVVGALATNEGTPVATSPGSYTQALMTALRARPRWSVLGAPAVVSVHFVHAESLVGSDVVGQGVTSAVSDLRWAMRNVLGDGERLSEVWVTRAGWRSDGTPRGNGRQMQEVVGLGAALRGQPEYRPELVSWYAFNDGGEYGLFDGGRVANSARRSAYDSVVSLLGQYRPDEWASLGFTRARQTVDPGERVQVQVRGTNRGANRPGAPDWREVGGYMVGQAEGCPSASEVNGVRWVDVPDGGVSAPFVLGARVPLVLAGQGLPGVDFTVTWSVEAPSDPGDHLVAAQMIHDGHWFGQTAVMTLTVRRPDLDGGLSDASLEPTEDLGERTDRLVEPTEDLGERTDRLVAPTEDLGERADRLVAPTEDLGERADRLVEPMEDLGEHTDASGEPTEDLGEHTDASGEHTDASGEHTDASGEPTEDLGEHTDALGRESGCGCRAGERSRQGGLDGTMAGLVGAVILGRRRRVGRRRGEVR